MQPSVCCGKASNNEIQMLRQQLFEWGFFAPVHVFLTNICSNTKIRFLLSWIRSQVKTSWSSFLLLVRLSSKTTDFGVTHRGLKLISFDAQNTTCFLAFSVHRTPNDRSCKYSYVRALYVPQPREGQPCLARKAGAAFAMALRKCCAW